MNAMGWDDATGELVDPYGGRADLDAGVLRHTSDKFSEDPLRVLRGVQFAGRFDLELAPQTAALCQEIAPTFAELNKSGIWDQFHKLTTKGTHISKALEALHAAGWEQHFPGLAATRGIPQDRRWHPEGAVNVHLGLSGDEAARIARRDGLDEEETSILVLAAITHDFGKAHSTRSAPTAPSRPVGTTKPGSRRQGSSSKTSARRAGTARRSCPWSGSTCATPRAAAPRSATPRSGVCCGGWTTPPAAPP